MKAIVVALMFGLAGSLAFAAPALVALAQGQECKVSGTVPDVIKKHTCFMATSIHGDVKLKVLTYRVKREVAREFRSESVDAEELLLTILNSWKMQKKNNRVGFVKVYYGRVHLATARTRFGRSDVVEFK